MMIQQNGQTSRITRKNEKVSQMPKGRKTAIEALKEKEHLLHEQLVEQTQQLHLARAHVSAYQAVVEETLSQLEEIRQQLHMHWQQTRA